MSVLAACYRWTPEGFRRQDVYHQNCHVYPECLFLCVVRVQRMDSTFVMTLWRLQSNKIREETRTCAGDQTMTPTVIWSSSSLLSNVVQSKLMFCSIKSGCLFVGSKSEFGCWSNSSNFGLRAANLWYLAKAAAFKASAQGSRWTITLQFRQKHVKNPQICSYSLLIWQRL